MRNVEIVSPLQDLNCISCRFFKLDLDQFPCSECFKFSHYLKYDDPKAETVIEEWKRRVFPDEYFK